MSVLKIARYVVWSVLVLVIAATVVMMWRASDVSQPVAYGGPFALTDSHGNPVTEKVFAGKAHAMFFGYTHCPDICPTTLADLSQRQAELGPLAAKITFAFVSVDPERDTPQVLKDYVGSFPGTFLALSGSREQTDSILKAYRIYAKKVPAANGNYTMDHTASVLLFDAAGNFRGTLDSQEDAATALAKLKKLSNS